MLRALWRRLRRHPTARTGHGWWQYGPARGVVHRQRIRFPPAGGNFEAGYRDDADLLWHHLPHVGWRPRPDARWIHANEPARWRRRRPA